jgi:hypothetical protein
MIRRGKPPLVAMVAGYCSLGDKRPPAASSATKMLSYGEIRSRSRRDAQEFLRVRSRVTYIVSSVRLHMVQYRQYGRGASVENNLRRTVLPYDTR